MSDQNDQNPPPLLLFPASGAGELAPDAFRPVPVTASLFPQEEGEADSFLGQTEPSDQPTSQPSTYSFFQQQPSIPTSHADPFANISQSNSQVAPPPTQPIGQAVSTPSPAMTPPRVASPPSGFSPAPFSSPGMPAGQVYSPGAPPPTGPSQVRSALSGPGPRSIQHKPMAHPMSGPPPTSASPMMTPVTGPPPSGYPPPLSQPQFDPNKPPPTSAEFQEISQHQHTYGAPPGQGAGYVPVQPHWFYCKNAEQQIWVPFSVLDTNRLEEAYNAAQQQPDEHVISVMGGRYDIRLHERMRYSIFWQEKPSEVRRCTWFYKSDEDSNKFIPYEEEMCGRLEEEYQSAITNNVWHRRIEFPGGETIVMHNPNVIVHFRPSVKPDEWGTSPEGQMRPRVVKRGVDDDIERGEPNQVDHLVFVVHGIGPVCDLRFRSIVECVDDFRSTSLKLLESHFKHAQNDGRIGRVEFLPVYWYDALHGDATGVDRYLRRITLGSISRLRRFTNDTLLDILFYSSPCYCQRIVDVVGSETNRLLALFKQRNPSFKGQVSMIGHSLGSLIVFDMLSHQTTEKPASDSTQKDPVVNLSDQPDASGSLEGDLDNSMNEISEAAEETPELNLEDALAQLNMTDLLPKFQEERIDMESLLMCDVSDLKEMGIPLGPRKKLGGFLKEQVEKQKRRKEADDRRAKEEAARAAREEEEAREREEREKSIVVDASNSSLHVDYMASTEGVGQPTVTYPQFDFNPSCFFAIGSPIGMFVTVRGFGSIGDQYVLPTCGGFFNIFHPFDPVAYRIEPLVNPSLAEIKPVLMPHHKGRKRFHLELKDSLATFGSDLKRGFMESMKKTWSTLHQFALAHRSGPQEASGAEVTEEDMEAVAEKLSNEELERKEREALASTEQDTSKLDLEMELQLGQLNAGRRIDYVLQEAPFESFNEYIFALGSHACYWESEDTVLMVLRELYALRGVFPIQQGPDKKASSIPATPH